MGCPLVRSRRLRPCRGRGSSICSGPPRSATLPARAPPAARMRSRVRSVLLRSEELLDLCSTTQCADDERFNQITHATTVNGRSDSKVADDAGVDQTAPRSSRCDSSWIRDGLCRRCRCGRVRGAHSTAVRALRPYPAGVPLAAPPTAPGRRASEVVGCAPARTPVQLTPGCGAGLAGPVLRPSRSWRRCLPPRPG